MGTAFFGPCSRAAEPGRNQTRPGKAGLSSLGQLIRSVTGMAVQPSVTECRGEGSGTWWNNLLRVNTWRLRYIGFVEVGGCSWAGGGSRAGNSSAAGSWLWQAAPVHIRCSCARPHPQREGGERSESFVRC